MRPKWRPQLTLAMALAAGTSAVTAEEEVKVRFAIQRQPVDTALLRFAQQAQVPVLFPSGTFEGVEANPVEGEYRLEDALDILLEGTNVEATLDDSGQLVVRVVPRSETLIDNEGDEVMSASSQTSRSRNFIISALGAAISAIASGVANAQDQAQAEGPLEEITVTGSRIRTTSGFATPVPVTSMTTDELFDFEPGNTLSQQLDALPQFFDTRTLQDTGRPSSFRSAAALNLRNLGQNRTLVLLDGSRVAPLDKDGTVDTDLLPSALFRSVDIVTGGASAAYGADAVGGVVNFVLDREFEGLDVKIGGGQHEGGEGTQWQVDIAGGWGFFNDRFHVIGAIQSREVDQVEGDENDVDNFRRIGWVTNPEWVANPELRGTKGTPQRLTLPNVCSTLTSPTGLIKASGTPLHMKQFTIDGTDIQDFVLGGVVALPGSRGSTQSMSGGPECASAFDAFTNSPTAAETITRSYFLGFKFDVTDRLSFTLQGRGGRTEANVDGAALRVGDSFFELGGIWAGRITADNAFLPENVRQIMIDNGLDEIRVDKLGSFLDRPTEGSNGRNENTSTQWEWGWGFEYQIPGVEWTLQGHWQRAESKRQREVINKIRLDRVFLAMDAVRDPNTGSIVCRVQTVNPTVEQLRASVEGLVSSIPVSPFITSTDVADPEFLEREGLPPEFTNEKPLESPIGLDNTIRDCVPYNFLGTGNITPEALDYISNTKTPEGFLDQDFAEVTLSGDLFNLPAGPVSFAAGLTWRDQQFIDGAKAGAGTGVGGKVVTNEDLGPPKNAPELGIRGIPAGFTEGSPNISFFITVPNIGGQTDVWEWFWELNVPVWESTWGQDFGGFEQRVTLNGSFRQSDYDRSGDSSSWKVGTDFQFHRDWRLRWTRSRDVREPNFAELFDRRGGGDTIRDPKFNNASFQIFIARGGNPNLEPEEANTTTAGIVWQPTFAPWINGLQISVDWWDTEIEGRVDQLRTQRFVDECRLNGLLCDKVQRDPETDTVIRVFRQFVNLAGASASGTDLEVLWRAEPNLFPNQLESLTIRWLAAYLENQSTTPLGGVAEDVAGELDTPEYTHVLTANYGIGPWSIQLQNRFVDSTIINANWREGIDVDDNTISSMSWWNARVSYQDELANGANWGIDFNIQNIFDREPPVVPGFSTRGGTQQFSSTFDRFGRRYNLSFNYNF